MDSCSAGTKRVGVGGRGLRPAVGGPNKLVMRMMMLLTVVKAAAFYEWHLTRLDHSICFRWDKKGVAQILSCQLYFHFI